MMPENINKNLICTCCSDKCIFFISIFIHFPEEKKYLSQDQATCVRGKIVYDEDFLFHWKHFFKFLRFFILISL